MCRCSDVRYILRITHGNSGLVQSIDFGSDAEIELTENEPGLVNAFERPDASASELDLELQAWERMLRGY